MTVTTGKGIKAEERVRRLLLGARQYVHEIKDLQRRLNEIERNIQLAQEGIRVFGGANGRGAQPADPPCVLADRFRRQREDMNARILRMIDRRDTLFSLMEDLDDMQRRIITLRYLDARPWRVIARTVYLSERQGQRVQRAAIEQMARSLEEREKAAEHRLIG